MFKTRFVDAIADVKADDWNALAGKDYPFTRYEFLSALESAQVVNQKTGWFPQHLLVHRDQQLVAVMPLYIKSHSYGEYVFDWSWADAYHQHGHDYYPKLLAAIPYTPCTGPRICYDKTIDLGSLLEAITTAIRSHCEKLNLSSFHLLFPGKQLHKQFCKNHFMSRTAVHFQWFNQGFQHFDDFLNRFSSRKRKNLKKERRAIIDAGISFDIFSGSEMTDKLWERFYWFYQTTYAKRSGHGGYFNQTFFQQISKTLSDHLVVILAKKEGEYIAGALNFRDQKTLYGRYWGCIKEIEYLHFETCYYQGIEYCIKQGLEHFDPGVQGEHKLARGFEPVFTYSNHYLNESPFQQAISQFLAREKPMIEDYYRDCEERLPFKTVKR